MYQYKFTVLATDQRKDYRKTIEEVLHMNAKRDDYHKEDTFFMNCTFVKGINEYSHSWDIVITYDKWISHTMWRRLFDNRLGKAKDRHPKHFNFRNLEVLKNGEDCTWDWWNSTLKAFKIRADIPKEKQPREVLGYFVLTEGIRKDLDIIAKHYPHDTEGMGIMFCGVEGDFKYSIELSATPKGLKQGPKNSVKRVIGSSPEFANQWVYNEWLHNRLFYVDFGLKPEHYNVITIGNSYYLEDSQGVQIGIAQPRLMNGDFGSQNSFTGIYRETNNLPKPLVIENHERVYLDEPWKNLFLRGAEAPRLAKRKFRLGVDSYEDTQYLVAHGGTFVAGFTIPQQDVVYNIAAELAIYMAKNPQIKDGFIYSDRGDLCLREFVGGVCTYLYSQNVMGRISWMGLVQKEPKIPISDLQITTTFVVEEEGDGEKKKDKGNTYVIVSYEGKKAILLKEEWEFVHDFILGTHIVFDSASYVGGAPYNIQWYGDNGWGIIQGFPEIPTRYIDPYYINYL